MPYLVRDSFFIRTQIEKNEHELAKQKTRIEIAERMRKRHKATIARLTEELKNVHEPKNYEPKIVD